MMLKSMSKPRGYDLLATPGQPALVYTYNPATDDYEEHELRPVRHRRVGFDDHGRRIAAGVDGSGWWAWPILVAAVMGAMCYIVWLAYGR